MDDSWDALFGSSPGGLDDGLADLDDRVADLGNFLEEDDDDNLAALGATLGD